MGYQCLAIRVTHRADLISPVLGRVWRKHGPHRLFNDRVEDAVFAVEMVVKGWGANAHLGGDKAGAEAVEPVRVHQSQPHLGNPLARENRFGRSRHARDFSLRWISAVPAWTCTRLRRRQRIGGQRRQLWGRERWERLATS